MSIVKQDKKRQEKEQKEQQEKAQQLVKMTEKVIDFIVEEGFTEVWEFKTIHQMLSQRMQGAIDKTKIVDILK